MSDEKRDFPLSASASVIHKSHQIYINKKLKDIETLSFGQFPILMELYHKDNRTQEEIASFFKINEGTVSKNIRHLEDNNLVEKKVNPDNRRQNYVFITEKGRKLASEFKDVDKNWEKEICDFLSEEDLNKLKKTLNKIAKNSFEHSLE